MYCSDIQHIKKCACFDNNNNKYHIFQKYPKNHSIISRSNCCIPRIDNFIQKIIKFEPIFNMDIENIKILFRNPTILCSQLFGSYQQITFGKIKVCFNDINMFINIINKRKRALHGATKDFNRMVESYDFLLEENELCMFAAACCIFTNWFNKDNIMTVLDVSRMLFKAKNPLVFFSIVFKIPDLQRHIILTFQEVLNHLIKNTGFSTNDYLIKSLAVLINCINDNSNSIEKLKLSTEFFSKSLIIESELKKENEFSYLTLTNYIDFDTRRKALEYIEFADNFPITIDRNKIINDTMKGFKPLISYESKDLLKNIRIDFKGEHADDYGGPRNEFFNTFINDVMNKEDYFIRTHQKKLWFNRHSKAPPSVYKTIGAVVGLAFLNRITLPVQFAQYVWKFVLGDSPIEEDIQEIDEHALDLFASMRANARNIDELDYRFTIVESFKGKCIETPIVPNGENIKVTEWNLEYFIAEYFEYKMLTSIKDKMVAFKEGFISQTKKVQNIFSASELSKLISIEDKIDWSKLSKSLVFEGFDENSFTPYWLPHLISKWDDEKRKHFMEFSTGLSTPPESDFEALKIYIQKGSDINFLPFSHTCANILIIPEYSSIEELDSKLDICLSHSFGFGFK